MIFKSSDEMANFLAALSMAIDPHEDNLDKLLEIEAYLRKLARPEEGRNQIIEQCAKMCEDVAKYADFASTERAALGCAGAIRTLLEPQREEG